MIAITLFFLSGLLLLFLLSFNFFTRIQPEKVDLNFLRQKNLYAIHILRILEAPDYQYLCQQNRKYRDYLFLSYAKNLKKDMGELTRLPIGGAAYLYYLVFHTFYYALLLKNKIHSGVDDLRVLMGIELLLVRRASENGI